MHDDQCHELGNLIHYSCPSEDSYIDLMIVD